MDMRIWGWKKGGLVPNLVLQGAQSARHYESCKKIDGLAPPRCFFGTGSTVVQNISN